MDANDIINALQQQRNEAMDVSVRLAAQLAAAQRQVADLTAKLKARGEKKPKKQPDPA